MVGSSGISFSGLASGLDTAAIVQALVNAERIPIQTIEARRSREQGKLDLVGQLGDLVKTLKAKAEALSTSGSFFAFTPSVSDETVASVTAGTEAQAGSHELTVDRTAATDRWAFDPVSTRDQNLTNRNNRQVSFTVGTTSYSLTVDRDNSSLDAIALQINEMAGEDVSASVVNTGTDANPSYRLVLASKATGEDGRITDIFSNVRGGGEGLDIGYSPPDGDGDPTSDNNIVAGNDALATIDGLQIRRASNDLSNVIEGVTIDLLRATEPGETVTISIEPDREGVRAQIDEFIDAYNEINDFVNTQNTFTPSEDPEDNGGTSGLLFGDGLLTSVRQSIHQAIFNVDLGTIQRDEDGYSTLSLVGIQRDQDGRLSINEAVFEDKFTENLPLMMDLFADTDGFDNGGLQPGEPGYWVDQTEDSGLMNRLIVHIDRMFGAQPGSNSSFTIEGIFDIKREALTSNIDRFGDQIDQKEARLLRYEESLILRFTRLEELMGSLNAQGAALGNALGGQ